MHLQQSSLLSMSDGSFSLAGHLARSPGGGNPSSRLHSIEAILGFTKEDPALMGPFQGQEVAGGAARTVEEAEKRSPGRDGFPKMQAQELPGTEGPELGGPTGQPFEGEKRRRRRRGELEGSGLGDTCLEGHPLGDPETHKGAAGCQDRGALVT